MPGTPIPFPVSARPRRQGRESQGDILNLYASQDADVIQWQRVPGLKRFTAARDIASRRIPRGQLQVGSYLLSAWTDGIEATTAGGLVTPLVGEVAGSFPVTMAANIRDIPQIAIVAEGGAYLASTDTMTVDQYPLTDLGGGETADNLGFVNSVDYYAGYFVFSRPDGTLVASDLQSAQIPDLSYDRAQQAADGLLRVVNNGETLLAMGTQTIEVWQDVGKTPFPLARATVVPVGMLSAWGVAGGPQIWEHGVLFVANDFTVRHLQGYDPKIVSNDAVAYDIYQVRDLPDAFRAQAYTFHGNAIFSLSHLEWTWEYNLTTGQWHRRSSQDWTWWRGYHATQFNKRWYVQDSKLDGLLEIDAAAHHEDGDRLIARLDSAALRDFPVSVRIPALHFDFNVGLGTVEAAGRSGSDPAVALSWSHDGGATWSNPLVRSLGRQGQRSTLVTLRNIGRSSHRGVCIRWETADPVPVVFRQAVAPNVNPSRARQVKG